MKWFISPLNYFFHGSGTQMHKPVHWTNLNPLWMLDEMKKLQFMFPFKTLEDYMKRAGITNGYQSKPCLDPADPECPETAPNKKSQQVSKQASNQATKQATQQTHLVSEIVVPAEPCVDRLR